ncbi:MAG: hypothetical protein ACPGUV_06165, partial [Polyangiales bacterium]
MSPLCRDLLVGLALSLGMLSLPACMDDDSAPPPPSGVGGPGSTDPALPQDFGAACTVDADCNSQVCFIGG